MMTNEEAIEILKRELEPIDPLFSEVQVALDMAIEALSERLHGEWIDVNGDGSLWKCNQCKDTACCKGNFCPNCGAKMVQGGGNE